MTEQQTDSALKTRKRVRSPSFPFIPLTKALSRAREMEKQHKQFATSPESLASTWSLTTKSSTYLQTVSALKAFGLIEGEGAGKDRRIKLTELARRILLDTRPGACEAALKEAALKPDLLRELLQHWKNGRPSDDHCISELQLDRKFTPEAAANFLKVFDETFRFAGVMQSDSMSDSDGDEVDDVSPDPTVQNGDYVQWESQGELQFPSPRRVTKTKYDAEHGWYVWVEGHAGGFPMEQAISAKPPEGSVTPVVAPVTPTEKPAAKVEPAPPPAPQEKLICIERATMPLPEGVVALEYPSAMSKESFEDFEAWVEVIKKRAKRTVK